MRKLNFLDLRSANAPIEEQLIEAAAAVIRSGRFLHGPQIRTLEERIAAHCGASDCVCVSNGLDALRLIFRAYIEAGKLQAGDEVIAAGNTYIASILPISEFGLRPRLIDPDEEEMNLSLQSALENVTPATKAVVITHLYGTPSWDAEAAEQLHKRGVLIIEDNAQAIGAVAPCPGLHGSNVTGNLGDAAAFSFYPTKNIGALGDAGAVTTSDSALAKAIRALANYGSDTRYHNIYQGYNCRMDEIQAAMLNVKLSHLEEISATRSKIASIYDSLIQSPDIRKPKIFDDRKQVWHQYVVRVADRPHFLEFLESHGIPYDIHYAVPPHLQPCYSEKPQSFLLPSAGLPLTESMADSVVSLPIADLTEDEASAIASIIDTYRRP